MNTMLKTSLLALTILGASVASSTVYAEDEFNVAPGLTYAGAPLGLHGADPVALLNGANIDGSAEYLAAYDGVAYYFSSPENQALFEANPTAYLPENGGFCTLGVAYRMKLDGNPDYSAVVDDQLFVFVNEAALDAFLQDQVNLINTADEIWPEIRGIAASEL